MPTGRKGRSTQEEKTSKFKEKSKEMLDMFKNKSPKIVSNKKVNSEGLELQETQLKEIRNVNKLKKALSNPELESINNTGSEFEKIKINRSSLETSNLDNKCN